MNVLSINDKHGQAQTWWFNFLYQLPADKILHDLSIEFAKWGAELVCTSDISEVKDSIMFQNEEDMTWFLLHWS